MKIRGKIPITISPYFWLLAGMIGYLNTGSLLETLVWTVIVIVSVLVHEFGHALTALYFGQQVHIELVSFGGLTLRHGPKLKLWKEFLVVLNGPVMGFLLCIATYYIWTTFKIPNGLIAYAVQVTAVVNLFWTVLNLLPVIPLDGGRLMSIIFEGIWGVKGIKASLFISILLGVGIAIAAFIFHQVLIGALFFFLAFESYRGWQSSLILQEHDQDHGLQQLMKAAESDCRGWRNDEAEVKLRDLMLRSKGRGAIYLRSVQLLAALKAKSEDWIEVYILLKPIEKELLPESLALLHFSAFHSSHYEEALKIGTRFYQEIPRAETALLNARCCGLLNQARPAVGWLQSAGRDSVINIMQEVKKAEFDGLRSNEIFMNFVNSLKA